MFSVLTYDTSNKQSPVLVRNVSVLGYKVISARLINGYVYLSTLVKNDPNEYGFKIKIIALSISDSS